MMNRLTGKKYYRIEFMLASPLALGSGDNKNTDRDLLLNSRKEPYIPASSIAGVIRDSLLRYFGEDKTETVYQYLGMVNKATTDNSESSNIESRIIFYDAVLHSKSPRHISVRDSVSLDEYRTAKKGAKFDMEILEAGAHFCTYLEQSIFEGDDREFTEKIIARIIEDNLLFGGKSMRGYGEIKITSIGWKHYDLTNAEDLEKWLDFDIYEEREWKPIKNLSSAQKENIGIVLHLKQAGGISVRKYTTAVRNPDSLIPQPDYEQLTAHPCNYGTEEKEDSAPLPVIPGTSWAGAFRHRMKEFGVDISNKNSIFGYVDQSEEKQHFRSDGLGNKNNNTVVVERDKNLDQSIKTESTKRKKQENKKRSRIRFSESRIENAKEKILSRNALDRFSGGTADKALFTEKTFYGGTTSLTISWHGKEKMSDDNQKALAAVIADLHFGFLAVGGETSIGRGRFVVEDICGESVNDENVYEVALSQIKEKM